MFTYGGIQRVVTEVVNNMIGQYDITFLMPYEETDQNLFKLNENIEIVNLKKFPRLNKKSLRGIVASVIRNTNRRFGYLNKRVFVSVVECTMFSKDQKNAIVEYFNDNKFDVIISLGDFFTLLLASLAPQIKAKTIGWQHNTFESYFRMKGRNSYGLEQAFRITIPNLDRLIVLTEADRQKFSATFGIRTNTLYNPVSFVNEQSVPDVNNDMIFVGRLHEYQKGLDYLVKIMADIVKKKPKCRITVVGDGIDRTKLESRILDYGLKDNIQLVGMSSDVAQYYRRASVFLHTSRYEGFGVVLIEAMAFGIPVVAFHNNGPDEIITNNEDGYLIERFDIEAFADCVEDLISDPVKYKLMSINAKKRASDFAPSIIVKNFEEILKDVYYDNEERCKV